MSLPFPGPDKRPEGEWPKFIEKVDCPDGCGRFGRATRNGHVQGCKGPPGKPCWTCIGRRNKKGGSRKQRQARRLLDIAGPTLGADQEENWRHVCRIEVKSGARDAGPVETRYLAWRAQSDASHAIGDNRPFMGVAMPPGSSDGIVMVRLSELSDVAWAIVTYESRAPYDDFKGQFSHQTKEGGP